MSISLHRMQTSDLSCTLTFSFFARRENKEFIPVNERMNEWMNEWTYLNVLVFSFLANFLQFNLQK